MNMASSSEICVSTTEMHCEGEPMRMIESGFPELIGDTILEKREYARKHAQHYRRFITREPRGSKEMIGCLLTQPDADSGADVGVIFMDASIFHDMCGSGTLTVARYAVDKHLVKPTSPVTTFKIQAPCGRMIANVQVDCSGKTGSSSFISVPSFVFKTDIEVVVPTYGRLRVDLSFGGAFYAILPASDVRLDVNSSPIEDLIRASATISEAVRSQIKLQHPLLDFSYLLGTILTDGNDDFSEKPTVHFVTTSDHVEVSRSPCGSGTTARAALLYFKKKLALNQTRIFESASTHSQFSATPRNQVQCGSKEAVDIEIGGRAYYTGTATFTLEEGDKLGQGYIAGMVEK